MFSMEKRRRREDSRVSRRKGLKAIAGTVANKATKRSIAGASQEEKDPRREETKKRTRTLPVIIVKARAITLENAPRRRRTKNLAYFVA